MRLNCGVDRIERGRRGLHAVRKGREGANFRARGSERRPSMQQTIKTVPNVFNQTESRRRDGRKEGRWAQKRPAHVPGHFMTPCRMS